MRCEKVACTVDLYTLPSMSPCYDVMTSDLYVLTRSDISDF